MAVHDQGWASKLKHGAKAAMEHSTVEPMAIHMHIYIYNSNTNPHPPLPILFANYYKHPLTFSHRIFLDMARISLYMHVCEWTITWETTQ